MTKNEREKERESASALEELVRLDINEFRDRLGRVEERLSRVEDTVHLIQNLVVTMFVSIFVLMLGRYLRDPTIHVGTPFFVGIASAIAAIGFGLTFWYRHGHS